MIAFEKVSKSFVSPNGTVDALLEVDLTIEANEFVALIGPSGCGKSTLLNMAAGLLEPSTGRVTYDGTIVDGPNTRVSYMTQRDTLLPWRTSLNNVVLPLEIQKVDRAEQLERGRDILAEVGLRGFENHYPSQLSGGMRKRVALARTLISGANTILMDEPFGAVDAQLRLILQQQFLTLLQKQAKTVIFVTHDLFESVALADRVVVMSARPGSIRAVETVPLGRDRDINQGRFDPRLSGLQQRLWSHLAPEVEAGIDV